MLEIYGLLEGSVGFQAVLSGLEARLPGGLNGDEGELSFGHVYPLLNLASRSLARAIVLRIDWAIRATQGATRVPLLAQFLLQRSVYGSTRTGGADMGYLVPAVLILATLAGAQLGFGQPWITVTAGLFVVLALPYGDLHGSPLFRRLIRLAQGRKRKRGGGYKRHRYYSP